jgi:predicted RNase H-like nuclease
MQLVGGLDGCRGGWVLATTSVHADNHFSVEVLSDLKDLLTRLDTGVLSAAAIDTPIGLPDSGSRCCDVDARALIGPRRSSVFPAPPRCALGSTNYEEACRICRAVSNKSMSRQAFAILPKIEEVDRLMSPERQSQLVETHPEVSFTALTGTPMAHWKRTGPGRSERLSALRKVFGDMGGRAEATLPGAARDDVLDAFSAAWSAARWLRKEHIQLGGDLDSTGLRMEMIA